MLTSTHHSNQVLGDYGGYCPPEICGVCGREFLPGQFVSLRVVQNEGGMCPSMLTEVIHGVCGLDSCADKPLPGGELTANDSQVP